MVGVPKIHENPVVLGLIRSVFTKETLSAVDIEGEHLAKCVTFADAVTVSLKGSPDARVKASLARRWLRMRHCLLDLNINEAIPNCLQHCMARNE